MGFAFRVIHYFVLGRTFPVVSWLERSKEEPAHCFCRDQCDGYSLANRSPRTRIWLEVASLALGKDEGHSKAREMQLNLQGNFICLAYLKLSMKLAVYHSCWENTFCLGFELRMHYQKKNAEKNGWSYCSFIKVLKWILEWLWPCLTRIEPWAAQILGKGSTIKLGVSMPQVTDKC